MRALDLAAAERVAARVLDAAADLVDEAEVHVDGTREAFVRFADVGPTQCADREKVSLAVRLRKRGAGGWREASADVGSLEEPDWRRALERAAALVEVSPENPNALALPTPAEVGEAEHATHAVATERHGIEGKVPWVEAALRATEEAGLAPAGLAITTTCATTVANSRGLSARGSTSTARFSLTASGSDASGIGQAIARDAGDLDVETAVRRGVEKALAARAPVAFEPRATTVVLEPLAVSAALLFASYRGFGAREVEEGSSFLVGRVGERVFSPEVTIHDDARHPLLGSLPFDGEGVPRRRVTLVEAGVLRDPVTDRAHAARLGLPCTGHGRRQPSEDGPAAGALVVGPGRSSLEELIAGVDDGLLVTQLHYTNLIDPRDLVLTGMTRNGTYRIRGGEVVGAVRNLRFTQSLVEALGRVRGVGDRQEVCGALFDGHLATPALVLDDFRFTSTTDF